MHRIKDLIQSASLKVGTMILASALTGSLVISAVFAETQTNILEGDPTTSVRDLYSVITTPMLAETRDFYVTHFGYKIEFEANWYLFLSGPADAGTRGATLAFMHPDHPSNPLDRRVLTVVA